MTSVVQNVAFDCANPYELAGFWSLVSGHPIDPECRPGDDEAAIELPSGLTLFFQQVPEPKQTKNRVHVCLRPAGPNGLREGEIERLVGLGATVAADHREANGLGWVVLADPEGNEFCMLRGQGDRTQDGTAAKTG